MTTTSAEADSNSTWGRARHYLAQMRDWAANGNSPYSPFFCASLLIGVALIIEIGH